MKYKKFGIQFLMMINGINENGLEYFLSLVKGKLYTKEQVDEILDKVNGIEVTITGNVHLDNNQFVYLKSYEGNLLANSGYTLTSATITMDGNDITNESYDSGHISIDEVLGDIVIVGQTS